MLHSPVAGFLATLALVLALAVPSPAVGIRIATFNVEHGLEAPGTVGHDAVLAVLTRIDADIIALQEIQGADLTGHPSHVDTLASGLATHLGWANHHIHVASTSGALDTVTRVALISRYPISSATDIAPPAGSKDMARKMPAIVIDVPGTTNDPTIIATHLKCCFEDDDHFRRAVEMHRLSSRLASAGLTSTENIVILGDFNLIGYNHSITRADYDAFSHLLPSTYALGPDVTFPIAYRLDPGDYLGDVPMIQLDSRQTTGSDNTQGSNTLDYILATPALTSRPHATEIYSSVNDTSNSIGLPKFGAPLPFSTSGDASDHKPVFGDFSLDSATQPYHLVRHGVPVVENFDAHHGSSPPIAWTTPTLPWRGADDGASPLSGHYAYGPADGGDPALGVLHDGSPATATASFTNLTGTTISALELTCAAEQWHSALGGTADTWQVDLLAGGQTIRLPDLDFTATTNRPDGPVPGGVSTALSAVVTGLAIANADPFQLRWSVAPGAGGGVQSSDVFLNEFHYDNDGTDTGEFVEVVVGPGYNGALANLSVVLYNGSNGTTYGTETLDTFSLGTTTDTGHRIYHKEIAGIQNGGPDGIAILSNGTVLHILSYEGSFTASNGPGTGMTSTNIGHSQPSTTPIGQNSIGLTGSGDASAAFSWIKFTGDHTKGAPNDGQTFTTPLTPQGIAIDNLSVTALVDTDLDGLPDLTDPDDDNDSLPDSAEATLGTNPLVADTDGNGTDDGDEDPDHDRQSNAAEVLVTLTNPLDPNSLFTLEASPSPGHSDDTILSFPSIRGRSYTVWLSHDLVGWIELGTTQGTGATIEFKAPGNPARSGNFFRIEVSIPTP